MSLPKLYLAAMFSRRSEMEEKANTLKRCGFEITARWVYGGEEGKTREDIALLDLEDVDKADIVVSFSMPHGTPTIGGGRHVEFGYGLAKGKKTVLIGERENVFHHHPDVEVHATLELWVKSFNNLQDAAE